jgi:chemotaxis protein methyltransferase CheR
MSLSPQDFEFVRTLVRDTNGNVIGDDKAYLLETRLQPLAVESGCGTLATFLQHVRQTSDRVWRGRITEALLITETYFFREPQTFEFLSGQILPELIARNIPRPLRLWSAACSSGQEVYSLALLLAERFGSEAADRAQITGSDICSRVLEQARRAEFSSVELARNLPEQFRSRFIPSLQPDFRRAARPLGCRVSAERAHLL